ncbi:hypothetical protein ACTM9K_13650 [Bariatricus sp. HCP3S3_E12]|uniref:hypothetical protein n=1 Tax=Bariatricus sp. HCP3S3_E12 TaxID=3438906 RepID=UPI003F8C7FBC
MNKKIIVLSGVSGVGKSTIITEIKRKNSFIKQAKSDTTRISRGENDFYRFVSEKEFFTNLKKGQYVEHNCFNGNFYGINRTELREIVKKGAVALVDCNTAGLIHLLNDSEFKDKIISFYIVASPQSIYERLKRRNTETDDSILKRMREGIEDIRKAGTGIYDYMLLNDDGQQMIVADKILQALTHDPNASSIPDTMYLEELSSKQETFCKALAEKNLIEKDKNHI